jgi:hypothetical protein
MAGSPQKRARKESAGLEVAPREPHKPPGGWTFNRDLSTMPNVSRVLAGHPLTSDELRHARDLADSIVASLVRDARPEIMDAITKGMAQPDDNAALNGAKLAFGVLDRAKRIDISDAPPAADAEVVGEYVDSE